jgi:uncharacterized protein (DUF488 family)
MRLYTIGYSGYSLNEFLKELKSHHVNCVVDVRSNPHSQRFPDFNKENLEQYLNKSHILYRHYDKEFGARQEDKRFYTNGILDFSKFVKSESFKSGVQKILKGMQLNFVFALMCAEKDPMSCHRGIMIAREFRKLGIHVIHLSTGTEETQQDMEIRLLEKYFPERDQITFFGSPFKTDAELLDEAYALKNRELGIQITNYLV